MARRLTRIGFLLETDEPAARKEVEEAIRMAGGNLNRAAHILCIKVRHIYRILWRLDPNEETLWTVVDEERALQLSSYLAARERLTGKVSDRHAGD